MEPKGTHITEAGRFTPVYWIWEEEKTSDTTKAYLVAKHTNACNVLILIKKREKPTPRLHRSWSRENPLIEERSVSKKVLAPFKASRTRYHRV